MRLNARRDAHLQTHEGAPAVLIDAEARLRRSVMACLLWEDEFYEDGETIADRIVGLVAQVDPATVAGMAIEARQKQNLRHAPLLLISALAKTGARTGAGAIVADLIPQVIRRADELAELLAIHARVNGVSPKEVKKTIPAAMKRGLAAAFGRFDEYHLAKYDRAGPVRLRDVLFLTHPKPRDEAQAALWTRLADNKLATPDTWEVALSGGADKHATFERLIREGNLGYLALLRNLRSMVEVGCDPDLVRDAILARKGAERVLPFRYVAAARACPQLQPEIDKALYAAIETLPALAGRTTILVDVSGSMDARLSAKSDMTRLDAAAALASVMRGDLRVFSFSNRVVEVAPRRGMAGVEAIRGSQPHGGTELGKAVRHVSALVPHDRLIVITDEQSHDPVPDPVAGAQAYMINVASARNGVGYGPWTHIDGWSEHVLRFIAEHEAGLDLDLRPTLDEAIDADRDDAPSP